VLAIENAELFQEAHRARTATEISLTDLRRTRYRLAQSEKIASLGQLTAGIAHEIKNPLNFVNNVFDLSVDLLNELNEAVGPDRLTVADGRRADGIVKKMLLRSHSGPSEHRAIDLNIMIEEALNLAYRGARAETPAFDITMEKDLDPNAGAIDAFPQELLRVMLNLINNGFYAARNRANQTTDQTCEPTPRLTTRDLGDQVEIRVRDNGAGISDGARDKMFEPFFITMPAGEGIGLGLSLSYDIVVKQHGGRLTVDSLIDTFTGFTITLPRRMASIEGSAP
jgi:signal transduction histidine kinase